MHGKKREEIKLCYFIFFSRSYAIYCCWTAAVVLKFNIHLILFTCNSNFAMRPISTIHRESSCTFNCVFTQLTNYTFHFNNAPLTIILEKKYAIFYISLFLTIHTKFLPTNINQHFMSDYCNNYNILSY